MNGVSWGSAPRLTLGEVVDSGAEKWADKTCMWFGEQQITYGELVGRTNSYANGLLGLGAGRGDRVGVLMENCPEMAYAWFGTGKAGAIEVATNTAYRGEYLRHQLATCGTSMVLIDASLAPRVFEIADALPELRTLIVRSDSVQMSELEPPARLRMIDIAELLEADHAKVRVDRAPTWTDPCAIQFTGGTTGRSKGAVMSHNMQVTVARTFAEASEQSHNDVVYSPLPMFHFSIKTVVLLSCLLTGATAAVDQKFSVQRTWDQVRRYGATGVNILGSMIQMLWNQPPSEDDRTLPVRYIIGVPIPEHLHRPIEERYGCRLISVYGMSETGTQTITRLSDSPVPGASGTAVPHYEVKILDGEDREVPAGEPGEVVCRPLQPHVIFEGYFADPEGTLAAQSGLWFHTGDLGKLDDRGNLYFVDRKKDAIRRRGENISSMEVELVILKHPAVAEVVAHAVPSEFTEDDVKICVILAAGETLTAEELTDYCVKNLPSYAVPRYVEFMDDLPRTPVGRPQKNVLRQRGVTAETWDRESAGYKISRA